jgi:hypothetical protein
MRSNLECADLSALSIWLAPTSRRFAKAATSCRTPNNFLVFKHDSEFDKMSAGRKLDEK